MDESNVKTKIPEKQPPPILGDAQKKDAIIIGKASLSKEWWTVNKGYQENRPNKKLWETDSKEQYRLSTIYALLVQ